MDKFTILYVLAVNVFALIFMGLDKKHARSHGIRFPEKLLFLVAAIGGSIGIYMGMWIFTHKTRKKLFLYGIPLIFAVQLIIVLIAINE